MFSTFFFVGYNPVLPGTTTSLVCVLLVYLLFRFFNQGYFYLIPVLAGLVSIIGIPISTAAEEVFGGKDPGKITIDEVAGVLLAFSFIQIDKARFPLLFFAGIFLVFRALDIRKPFFIFNLQKIKGGAGVMIDDIVCGIITNLIMRFSYYFAFGEFI